MASTAQTLFNAHTVKGAHKAAEKIAVKVEKINIGAAHYIFADGSRLMFDCMGGMMYRND